MRRVDILLAVGDLVARDRIDEAKATLLATYPLAVQATPRTTWSKKRLLAVYQRDGFTDRYFGEPLVLPGALRAMSLLLGDSFPYHPNWKQSATHPAIWDLSPTIDHVIPVARGGADDESNIVTTSMARNAAKANFLPEEVNYPSVRAAVIPGWDGMQGWFLSICEHHPSLRDHQSVRDWRSAIIAMKRLPTGSRESRLR